jgi:hypothetical protein
MAIRNQRLEELRRLELKGLEARFLAEIQHGLNCSPFEGEAVMEVVREVFFPHLQDNAESGCHLQPGRIALVAVRAEEPAGKPLACCGRTTVTLTVHRGAQDDALMSREGFAAFRRARIPDLCQQALSQGGVLTREDLAYHVFYVSPRTISRDLKALRQADPEAVLPLRSNKHDIGPVLTHRVRIIELALEGRSFSQIRATMRHSGSAIANYLNTFTRVVQLHRRGLQAGQIAFLLRRSKGLVGEYLALLAACQSDANRHYHLEQLLLCDGRGWQSEDEKKASPHRSAQQ